MAVGAHEDESSADGGGLSTKWAQGPGWAGRGGRHPTVELQKDDLVLAIPDDIFRKAEKGK